MLLIDQARLRYAGTGGTSDIINYLKDRILMHQKIASIDDATRFVSSVLSTVDKASPEEFLAFLDEECEFRFASNPPIHGKEGIRREILDLFAATKAIEHTWADVWSTSGHVIIRGKARYVFRDGQEKVVPYCDAWRIGDNGKINRYEIFCDMNV